MIKIAITGPESSGKTTLCESLSDYFKISYIPEYARTYLTQTNGKYNQSDLDKICQGQLENFQACTHSIRICDSDFSTLEIWSYYKYGNVSELINNSVKQDIFDLHILCSPDIPWEADTLRENPDNRDELFELYKQSLLLYNKHFIIVSGNHKKRLSKSLKSIVGLQEK